MAQTDGEARPWLSRGALAVMLALVFTAAAGLVLRLVAPAPPGSAELARLASGLLVTGVSELKPEPQEAFTYGLLILMSPLLVGGAALLAGRIAGPGPGRLDLAALGVAMAAGLLTVVSDEASGRFAVPPLLAGELVALSALAAVADARFGGRAWAAPLLAALAALGSAVLLRHVDWRDLRALHAPALHFEAFAYSVVASAGGRTCLVDLPTQYGCYGAVLGPLARMAGPSVSHLTLIFTGVCILAVAAMALFAALAVRSPALAAALTLALPLGSLRAAGDVYFQYMPLRTLFPALSFPLLLWWEARPGAPRAAALGAFGALAAFWNPDAGVPVAGALLLYILLAGAPRLSDAVTRARLGASFAATLGVASAALLGGLALAGGRWPDVISILDYHRIFVVAGFYMLPMPPPPAAWTALAALAVGALAWFARRFVEGRPSQRADRAAFAAVLAVGLFSYYVGRSHAQVLEAVCWPFLVLMVLLLDAAVAAAPRLGLAARGAGAFLASVLVASAVFALPVLRRALPPPPDPTVEDVAFVRSRTPTGAPLALVASKQAVILGELGRRPALPGPGWAEVLTRRDADAMFDGLVKDGPRDVFVSADLIWDSRTLIELAPWVAERLPRLNAVYDVTERGPGGRLIHYVRRAPKTPRG